MARVYIYVLRLMTPDGNEFHSGCFSTKEKALQFAEAQRVQNGNKMVAIYRDLLQ